MSGEPPVVKKRPFSAHARVADAQKRAERASAALIEKARFLLA